MAVYKNKFVLEAERMVKVGKYVAKECEVEFDPLIKQIIATGVSDKEAYQDLKKLKNSTADYEEINVAVLEAVAENTFQKQSEFELPPHKQKKELFLETEDSVSSAKNASAAKELFEGRKNYKELVNDLNYPRGLEDQTRYKKIGLFKKCYGPEKNDPYIRCHGPVPASPPQNWQDVLKVYTPLGWKMVNVSYQAGEPYTLTGKDWSGKVVTKAYDKWYVLELKKEDPPGIFDNRLDTWYKMPYYGKANHLGQLHILEDGDLHCPVKLGEATIAFLAAETKKKDIDTDKLQATITVGQEENATDTEKQDSAAATSKLAAAIADVIAAKKAADADKTYAPHFVAVAFREFQKNYNKRAKSQAGQLSPKSRFLKIIKPKKGYQNKMRAYEGFLTKIKEGFFANVLEKLGDSRKIKNIDDFSEFLVAHLEKIGEPITMIGYFEKYLNIYMTGLAVDIHDGDSSSDQEKIEFLEDPNYPVYAYFAAEQGFKIDPNVPWRLIADVRTAKMHQAIEAALSANDFLGLNAGIGLLASSAENTMNVFKKYNPVVGLGQDLEFKSFEGKVKASAEDTLTFKSLASLNNVIEGWYRDFKKVNPHYVVVESTINGTKVTKRKRKKAADLDSRSIIEQLMFYIRVRNYECQNVLSAFKIKMLKTTIKQILNSAAFEKKAPSENTDLCLTAVETMLGTYAARNLPLEQKGLTKIEKSWTMVSSFTKHL